jgi:hypothetical protein
MEIIITEGQFKKLVMEATPPQQNPVIPKPKNQTYSTVQDRVLTKDSITGGSIKIPKGTRFTAHQNGDKKITTPTYTASVDRTVNGKIVPSTVYYCNGKNAGKFWNGSANSWFYDKTKVLSGYLSKNLCGKSLLDQSYFEAKKIDVKGQRTISQLVNYLRNADTLDDDEVGIEKAFSEIKTWERYNEIKKQLGQDPYKYVSQFIDVREKHGPIQSVTTSFSILSKGKTSDQNNPVDLNKNCPLVLTDDKPGGPKQYAGSADFIKQIKPHKTPGSDPLLYGEGGFAFGKIPSDFGWKFNNDIYPFPTYYSQDCLSAAKQIATKFTAELKEAPIEKVTNSNSETTRVNKIATPQLQVVKNVQDAAYYSRKNDYNKMQRFNQALSKQKEVIPKYCKTALSKDQKYHITMYTVCKNYGGLWVYGAGTSKYLCGCRDMSNTALNVSIKTNIGDIKIMDLIKDQQESKNWSNVDSRQILWTIGAIGAAFIPIVGPFVSAGVALGGAADLWTSGKKKEAAIAGFFAVLPLLGKIPGVGQVSENLSNSLRNAVIEGGALSESQLNTLMKIIKYDEQISNTVLAKLEQTGLSTIEKKVLEVAVKETEKKIVEKIGTPTYGDTVKAVKKELAGNVAGAVV